MKKTFECNFCDKESSSRSKLRRHEELCRPKHFVCSMCDFKCSRRSDLINHSRRHTGERPFMCSLDGCQMRFKQQSHLSYHMKYKHSDDRPFECNFQGCHHTEKTSTGLKRHMKVHSNDRPFVCQNSGCGFRTKRKEHLSRHVSGVHDGGSKTFACSECSYKTDRKGSLKSHSMRRHLGTSGDFQCSHVRCKKSFKSSQELKTHVRNRHEVRRDQRDHPILDSDSTKPFQCPLCFKIYANLSNLRSHSFAHTNEKPLKCGHCDYATSYRNCLRRHIAVVHANVKFPFIVLPLNDRECLQCDMILPAAEFVVHSKGHEGS